MGLALSSWMLHRWLQLSVTAGPPPGASVPERERSLRGRTAGCPRSPPGSVEMPSASPSCSPALRC